MQNNIQPPIMGLHGRFNRLTFLGWNCLLLLIILGFSIAIMIFMPNTFEAAFIYQDSFIVQAILIILNIVTFFFVILFSIKRLHDFKASGWIALFTLVPFINILFFIFLIFMPGDEGGNKYGSPRTTQTWESILAGIWILMMIMLVFTFGSLILRFFNL